MDHGLKAANQELAKSILNLHRDIETMLKDLLINLNIMAGHNNMMKLFLEMQNFENGGRLLVCMVKLIKITESFLKLMKEGFREIENIRASTSDINKLKETFLESYKIPMKMVEEMSPEIGEILEKLDKPVSLLELGLERVQELGFIQEHCCHNTRINAG